MSGRQHLVGERIAFGDPWTELLALPIAMLVGLFLSATSVGRIFLFPIQLQLHELGHALVAWLSSRAALPLPFGFTFWREDQSTFTGGCVVFLLSVLMLQSLRESRRFGALLSITLLAAFFFLSLGVSSDRSRMVILTGGLAGELVFSCLLMVGFYFHLPDRMRWDFFRFVALVPAAAGWLASARMWLEIRLGRRPLPRGSILGTPGDGSGDLDRLIGEYGFTEPRLVALYLTLVVVTALVLAVIYGRFAVRALRTLRAQHLAARLGGKPQA